MRMRKHLLFLWLFILNMTAGCHSLYANNITVSNISKQFINTSSHYMLVQFTLAWENSWRDAENWDAAWVFIKFRLTGSPVAWSHATLNYVNGTNDGHSAPVGANINTSSDGKGVFIYRTANGSGSINFTNAQLRWNYGADGLADNVLVDISVSAIEMVYVPTGSFWLGDGSNSLLHGQFENGTSGNALQVIAENGLTLGGGTPGSLGNNNRAGMANNGLFSISPFSIDDFDDGLSRTLPASFPKGYNGFYCMKYEITQAQYADFLNKISAAQFATRYDAFNYTGNHGGFTVTRYNITGTYPNMTTITPDLPAIYVEWYDAAAYADWAALRPMTELEFEKACRGPALPVANEFAWGNANINSTTYFPINNQGQNNESIGGGYTTIVGNAWYADTRAFGAVTRVGVFAAHPSNTGRITSGATYWGIMEMSGHCWERTVSVGRTESRNFMGTHGDGLLFANGNATNTDWPGYTAGQGVNTAIGCGYRGGAFDFPNPTQPNLRVSSRILATAFYNTRYFDDAARFVRTIP
jgi:formylglycine-generating enzyme required for sulfatase activity